MIEARLFYAAAERIFLEMDKIRPEEVLLRIIMGRTYYAGFLDARGKARAEGGTISTTGRAHSEVRLYYEGNKGETGLRISRHLVALSDYRKMADYDIDQDISIEDAEKSLALCKALLGELAGLK